MQTSSTVFARPVRTVATTSITAIPLVCRLATLDGNDGGDWPTRAALVQYSMARVLLRCVYDYWAFALESVTLLGRRSG